MKIEWNKVTWYSKLFAAVLFIVVALLGFWAGRTYQKYAPPVYRPDVFLPAHTFGNCLADNGVNCNGCSVANSDYDMCLAIVPEGEIRGTFSSSGTPSATLIARGKSGKATFMDVPFGFDRVVRDAWGNGYYVVTANRENDVPKSFDKVFLVSFTGGDASITPIISDGGFGGYDSQQNTWYAVAREQDYSKLTMKRFVFGSDGPPEAFAFGKLLITQPGYDKESFITGAEMLSEGDVVLNFGKVGLGKGDIYTRYLVSFDKKTVQRFK